MTRTNAAGHGCQVGPMRPDWGPDWAELACDQCPATWVGPIGEPCRWCAAALDRQRLWQHDLALEPPDVERDAADYTARMKGWAERLAIAVRSGIVTEAEARRAWEREQNRAA